MTFEEIKDKLSHFKIGIAGAGGLGSNCAASLIRAGVKKLVIADFDVVCESNLNRQFYFADQIGVLKVKALNDNLLRIYSNLDIDFRVLKITHENVKELFQNCDVIVEAFDDKHEKQMLIESVIKYLPNIPLVIGSGMAGWGDNNSIVTEKFDNLFACGDKVSEINEDLPPIGPRVGIVANMQANQVLEILLGKM
ncbi:MAG: sulfur carrier protein ThiS adenylyltransferase ThiF [Salinivirgaceae bacterium]|jgi:sulfur carrier protein ThiS adenylyltransferase|nr:sulfur carrier protein ThiS adenylyltransferase ThiF [Salinivirgaceae bacterium]